MTFSLKKPQPADVPDDVWAAAHECYEAIPEQIFGGMYTAFVYLEGRRVMVTHQGAVTVAEVK